MQWRTLARAHRISSKITCDWLRWFHRNKSCRLIFWKISLSVVYQTLFRKSNKNDRSPCSRKICDNFEKSETEISSYNIGLKDDHNCLEWPCTYEKDKIIKNFIIWLCLTRTGISNVRIVLSYCIMTLLLFDYPEFQEFLFNILSKLLSVGLTSGSVFIQ